MDQVIDGYIRVSRVGGREGDSYISPTVQREAIERWAAHKGVQIVAWHVDEDQSGGTQDRPGLREAMRRVEAHETDGIACWKINRFARNVAAATIDVERIQAAGGHLAFVAEDIDTTGPVGSMVLTIMLAVAKLERDNITEAWSTAQQHAIERGAKVSRAPYGYQRRTDGVLEPHPVESTHMRRAFDLAAAQGTAAATRYLTENAPGRDWTPSTVRATLKKRTYLGESSTGKHVNPEAHEPLVSKVIWEAAQHAPRAQGRNATYPLSGLARCGTCDSPMVGGSKTRLNQPMYQCSASQTQHKGKRCPKPASIVAERLENHVREQIRPIIEGAGARAMDGGDEAILTQRAMTEAEAELQAFAADLTMRRALGSRYHDHLQARVDALDEAQAAYRAVAAKSLALEQLTTSIEILDENPRLFGELLRRMMHAIVVQPGRGSLDERVSFVPVDLDAPSSRVKRGG